MRIHHQGVGSVEPAEGPFPLVAEDEEPAVGAVDVQPETLFPGDRRDFLDGIDDTGVGRARARDNEKRKETGRAVARDRPLERIGAHPVALVQGHETLDRLRESREADGFRHRVVGLLGRVDDRALDVARPDSVGVPRRHHPHEIRDAAAGGEVASRGLLRKAHEAAHPLEEHVLHAHRPRRGEEHPRIAIGDRCEKVSEGGRIEAAPGDITEVSPRGGIQTGPIHVAPEMIEEMRERPRLLADGSLENPDAPVFGLDERGQIGKLRKKLLGVGGDLGEEPAPDVGRRLELARLRLELEERLPHRVGHLA